MTTHHRPHMNYRVPSPDPHGGSGGSVPRRESLGFSSKPHIANTGHAIPNNTNALTWSQYINKETSARKRYYQRYPQHFDPKDTQTYPMTPDPAAGNDHVTGAGSSGVRPGPSFRFQYDVLGRSEVLATAGDENGGRKEYLKRIASHRPKDRYFCPMTTNQMIGWEADNAAREAMRGQGSSGKMAVLRRMKNESFRSRGVHMFFGGYGDS